MNTATTMTTTPASTIARLVLSLVVALLLGTLLVPSVDASKKGKNTIASVGSRVQSQRDLCETIGGGTLDVKKTAFGTRTTCTGGTDDGAKCVIHKKYTKCERQRTRPPTSAPAVPPSGGVEEPGGGGGGSNAGGGAAVPPGGGVEDPGNPTAGEPVLQ